ncbi:hypothetical protein HK100_000693, partial [Physocladia obscura]
MLSIEDIRASTIQSEKIPCSLSGCLVVEKIVSLCTGCGKKYCLEHRHDVNHKCVAIRIQEAAAQEKRDAIQSFVREKLGFASDVVVVSTKTGVKKTTNYTVEFMKMKSRAK